MPTLTTNYEFKKPLVNDAQDQDLWGGYLNENWDDIDSKLNQLVLDGIAGVIESPQNQDYKLVVKIPFAGTISETTTISAAGTCTATFKINTTALGGTANSVSTSEQSQAHVANNTFAAGDDIVVTVSSNSSCDRLSFLIKYTRTLT